MVLRLKEEGRVIGYPVKLAINATDVRDASVSAERIDLDGESCILAITQDMTETKRLQAQFQQAQKMEAVGRLAGGIAHDFNNLLGVIMGYSEISRDTVDPALPISKHLTEIKLAAERAAHLTRQLLAFSRRQIMTPKALDLNSVIIEVSKMLKRVVGEDVTFSFRPSTPLNPVLADAGQIEQVLMNLVVNARDAMPEGGEISIETANVELDENYGRTHEPVTPGEYVMLSVRDTGCGMDEGTRERVFEPFFTTKEPGKGTGLGLASVYGIVKQSAGFIWVYSEIGRGTTFKLYFPHITGAYDYRATNTNADHIPIGNETILFVEDEAAFRLVTASVIQSAGYTVLEADTPATALRIVESYGKPIHLLVTDVTMPGMNGVDLSKRLKMLKPELKVIFISGYGGDDLLKQISVAPDAVLVEKPFSRNALLTKIDETLHRRRGPR